MSVSERLSQEDAILRQIRLTISTYRTVESDGSHRKGVMYASYAITSGRRLYHLMRRLGFKNPEEFRTARPEQFRRAILKPNLRDGWRFGASAAGLAVLFFLALGLAWRRRKAPSRARLLSRAQAVHGGSR